MDKRITKMAMVAALTAQGLKVGEENEQLSALQLELENALKEQREFNAVSSVAEQIRNFENDRYNKEQMKLSKRFYRK